MALDFFAGCVGGCAGILVGHPFDTIKVRLQTQDFKNPQYKGTIHCLQSILYKEGVFGLYRGITSPLAGVAVVNAIVFGVYGNLQRHLSNPDSLWSHFLAGASAGFVQSFICCPMELAKTRLQLQQNSSGYKNPLDCLVQVAKSEGIRGVFKGQAVTIAREIPGLGLYFLSYEAMTRSSDPNSGPISTLHMLFAGGMAGTISWVTLYPIDVVKSRLQADGVNGINKYNGAVDCFFKSIKNEGYSCLSRGLCSTIIRSFPTNAATFATVTWIFRLFKGNKNNDQSTYHLATGFEAVTLENNWLGPNTFNLKVCKLKEDRPKFHYVGSTVQWKRVLHHNSFVLLQSHCMSSASNTNVQETSVNLIKEVKSEPVSNYYFNKCEACGSDRIDTNSANCKSCNASDQTRGNVNTPAAASEFFMLENISSNSVT